MFTLLDVVRLACQRALVYLQVVALNDDPVRRQQVACVARNTTQRAARSRNVTQRRAAVVMCEVVRHARSKLGRFIIYEARAWPEISSDLMFR